MQKRKLTDEQVAEIRALAQTSIKRIDIARKYGVSPQLVSTVIRHGYDNRPHRASRATASPETYNWAALAKEYNNRYPDDLISAAEAKSVHDLAIKKMRVWFSQRNENMNDLV